ncbi:MAG: YlmH/Sll1252 family protein [Muribaculaceae bacterium]|nr:YlmH/Sll1252 family protein [Muribaculaceae bacterium]
MAGTGEKELLQLKKRLYELADKSYQRGVYTYTPFLSLSEQQVFHENKKELAYAGVDMEGGAPACDRKIIRFGSLETLGYEEAYPIVCLEMLPVTPKFADALTHRDFLGAIMNLGIERSTIGDIFVQEQGGVLFCQQSIAPYLTENLCRVKHTNIRCQIAESEISLHTATPQETFVTVSSLRIDGVIAKLYNISRNDSLTLFRTGRIFVNGIIMENNSYQLKEKDAVTVRGHGKFLYYGLAGETRKGKERVSLGVYV